MASAVHLRNVVAVALLICACQLALLMGRHAADAQIVSGVRATYNFYNAAANNYDYSGLYCATWDAGQPVAWRAQYLWTAYCASGGPGWGSDRSLCGSCLLVTNQRTQQSVVVRIVDRCANGGLDLAWEAFQAIDGDGAGYNAGSMTVTIQFVGC